MKKTITFLALIVTMISFAQQPKNFNKTALDEYFVSQNGAMVQFKNILEKHKGKTIFIDIWASWCSDCVGGIPELQKLQAQEKEMVYVMLSLDRTSVLWKDAIKKYNLEADHYLFTKKWKESIFCKTIDLDWIPRYMIVGKDGTIKLYKAIEFTDENIVKIIQLDK